MFISVNGLWSPYRERFGGTSGWTDGHDLLIRVFSPETNHALSCIRNVASRSREVIFSLLCSHKILTWMQYCIQYLVPCTGKILGLSEWIQGRSEEITKNVRGLEHLSCADTLRKLGLFSLKKRKLQGDLTVYVSILKSFNTWNA